tara:strand:+ start:969 stop:1403 length:435 start_codon:yes stop_codon:yes gene_type:complete
MRDKKRKELAMLEEAYTKVNENLGPAALTASVPGVSQMPLVVAQEPVEDESCGEYDQSEIDMAGRDLLKAQEYAAKLTAMVQQVPGLDGWVSAKITKASDYLSSVYHFLDYELREKPQEVVVDVEEIEAPVDVFNVGYEEAETT